MKRGASLCTSLGEPCEEFSLGDTIFVSACGVTPVANVTFSIANEAAAGKPEMLARLLTDRHGSLPLTALIPYYGLTHTADGWSTYEAAEKIMRRQKYNIRVQTEKAKGAFEQVLTFQIRTGLTPRVFASDRHGRMLTGVERNDEEIGVAVHNFPSGCVRLFVVRRQFSWRTGDPIDPVRTRDGTPLVVTARTDREGRGYVRLGTSRELGAGSYQFIARAYRPGWYESDEPVLLRDDVVSDRRFASLVVRHGMRWRFGYDNGVVLTPQIAGRPLAHRPYFHFVNNFPKGTDVYAALDPDALPAGLIGKKAAIYVIQHKTAADWAASNLLSDVSGPGMTPAVKVVPIVPGCVNWNTTLVWPNPQVPGKYDIVIDFGNNVADPSLFATDGTFDPPLDMIDGYIRVGFYVTEDPSLPGPFAGAVGQHDYALGSIDVPATDTGPTPTDSLPVTATVRYPAQYSGVDAPVVGGAFPLVVVMHGNSGMDTSYLGYGYLLDHLASWGFVAMSIYAPVGVMIETRARAILAHIGIMAQNNAGPGLFAGHIDLGYIGIAGHSRGAEAVVRAARINTAETLGWSIAAGVSIAPTDYFHYGDAGMPVLVIYGANDGDVSGSWPSRTCFDIYDELGRPRSFVFVYGGTHDRFNTEWASIEASTELTWDITPSDLPNLISMADHQNVAKGYVTAFLQAHLQGRQEQLEFLGAALKPSLVGSLQLHISHQEAAPSMVDNFQQLNPAVNTLGGAVTATALPSVGEDQLRTLDLHSPHVVAGANLAWLSPTGVYLSSIPAADKDISAYTTLAFRVSQKYASPHNPTGQPQDFWVRLSDLHGKSRAIRVSSFTDIPYPYVRGYNDLVKSAMKSVRIPLASYTIANAGAQDVDLTNLASISFEFDTTTAGEIDIDDIEFSS